MAVIYVVVGWLLGIWLAAVIQVDTAVFLILSLGGAVAAVWLRQQEQTRLWLVGLVGLGLGGARYLWAVPTITENHVAYYNGTTLFLTGLVIDEPDVRDQSVNLRVAAESLTLADGTTLPVEGTVLVRTARFPVIAYGSRIEVNGRLETPPEDPEFSYKAYLARQGIHSLIALPAIRIIAEGQGSPIYHAIFAFKSRAQATIARLIPDPQAALLTGILLGDDNGIPPDLSEDFRTTGLTHIIAISGFNISLIIAVLVGLSEPLLGQRGTAVFAIVGITLYTVLVGADASVVRAALMGGVYLLVHRWLGRPNFAYASLFLAALVMTAVNPFTLWDVGFQLSFAATLGLMLYATPFTNWVRGHLLRRWEAKTVNRVMGLLSEAVLLTLAAQVLTLPLMMGYFQQLSLISLVANAFVLPAQPGVMLWGGAATIAGLVFEPLGQLLGWVAWLFLSYTITLVRLFAAVPGAAVPVHISWAGILVIYGLIALFTWLVYQEPERRARLLATARQNVGMKLATGGMVLTAVLLAAWGVEQPDGLLHVAFLDVGQGDAIFIQMPSGRQILVDGGLYPTVLNDQLGRQLPFWDRQLDMVVATHPDADHVAGLVELFDRYTIDQLITNGEGMGAGEYYDQVLQAAETAESAIHPALAGEVIVIEDGVRLEVLHPGALLTPQNRNNNSVTLRLVYGDFTLLLTGDAEAEAEQTMLENGRSLQAIALKAGHHGSSSSSTLPFLQAVQPQIMVISAGLDNRYGHPHAEVLQRAADMGTAVLRTDELGTIELLTDGQTMWWQAWGK